MQPTTKKAYRCYIENWIKQKLDRVKINDITRTDVVAFHHDMRAKPHTANRTVAMLSKMFNLAEDWGLRTDGTNPRCPRRRGRG